MADQLAASSALVNYESMSSDANPTNLDIDACDIASERLTSDMCEFLPFDRHSRGSSSTPGLTTDGSSDASQDWDLDHPPPSPAPSVYSLTSSIIAQSYREEYGRKINNYSNIYSLPADEIEIVRLRKFTFHY
jgi:hypothetical protein